MSTYENALVERACWVHSWLFLGLCNVAWTFGASNPLFAWGMWSGTSRAASNIHHSRNACLTGQLSGYIKMWWTLKRIKKVHLNDSLKQVMRNQLFVKCPVQIVSIDRFSEKWPKSRRIVIWPKLYWYMAWKLHIPNLFHLSFTTILLSCTYFVLKFRLLTVRSRLHRGPKRRFCYFFSAVQ